MTLRIYTLGSFEIHRNGALIADSAWKTQKNKYLCKILLTYVGHALTKEQLMEWLWSELAPDAAGRNLRVAMSQLRKLLEPDLPRGSKSSHILTTDAGYAWNTDRDYWLDTAEFEQLCDLFDQDGALGDHQLEQAERANRLYQASYLEEDRYEDWAIATRTRLQEKYLTLLTQLAEHHAHHGRYHRALQLGQEVLESDPYRESNYAQLMLYHYLSGNPAEALRIYERCVQALKQGMDIEPGLTLQTLYGDIQAGHVPGVEQPRLAHPKIAYALSPGSVPFVGRAAELDQLAMFVTQAQQGKGQGVLLGGEAGVGKTRLVQEAFLAAGQRFDVLLLQSQGRPGDVQQEYHPWAQFLRQGFEVAGPKGLHSLDPLWLAEVARFVPSLYEAEPFPKNPPLPPPQAQRRLFEGVAQCLFALAHRHLPLVLFVDNLHEADHGSLDLLRYLLPRLAEHPVLLLCAYCSETVIDSHPLCVLLEALPANMQRLDLARLSAQSTGELLRHLPLFLPQSDLFYARLYQETQGNPLFLLATLQHLFEENLLQVKGDSWVLEDEARFADLDSLPVPPSIQQAIAQRVARLDENAQKLLNLASVIGSSIDIDVLKAAWIDRFEQALAALTQLETAQLLVRQHVHHEFIHAKVKEVVYNALSVSHRRLLHQRVFQALQRRFAGHLKDSAALLAHHAYHAGAWPQALAHTLIALTQATHTHRWQDALRWVNQGLEASASLPDADRSVQHFELLNQRVDIYDLLGFRAEQAQDLNELQALAKRLHMPAKQAEVALKQGEFYLKAGNFDTAQAWLDGALKQFGTLDDTAAQARCLNALGSLFRLQGQYDQALQRYQAALALHQTLDNTHGEAIVLNNIAVIHRIQGRFEQTLSLLRQASKRFEALQEPHPQATALANMGGLYYELGRYEEALRFQNQSLDLHREIGDRHGEAMNRNNLGLVYWSLGHFEQALNMHQKTLELRHDDLSGQQLSLLNLSNVLVSVGQFEQALDYAQRAMDLNDTLGQQANQSTVFAYLGYAYHHLNRDEEAVTYLQQALSLSRQRGDRWGQAFSLSVLGDIHLSQGRYAEALEQYAQAQQGFDKMGEVSVRLNCLSSKGLAHLDAGNLEHALACSKQAMQLFEDGQRPSVPPQILFNHFKVLSACKNDEATASLKQAYQALQARAAKIQDPTLRHSFLNHVTLNCKITKAFQHLNPTAS